MFPPPQVSLGLMGNRVANFSHPNDSGYICNSTIITDSSFVLVFQKMMGTKALRENRGGSLLEHSMRSERINRDLFTDMKCSELVEP